MSLSPAVSPSFCSLKMSSGLLYGLRASRCVNLSLSGLSCTSPTLFLCEAQAPFFGLDTATWTRLLMLLRGDGDGWRGLVRLASAGAGARTVTFLPAREQKIKHQKQHLLPYKAAICLSLAEVSIIKGKLPFAFLKCCTLESD